MSKGAFYMKRIYKTLAVSLLGIALVSGCGTKQEIEKTTASNKSQQEVDKQETKKESKQEQTIRLLEKKLSYTKDGKTYEEMAYLKTSKNQGFSLYALEGWELEAEEPNSDVLLKDDAFVRIRLIQPEDGEMDYAKLVEEQAKSVSSDASRQDTDTLQGFLHQAVWYKAYTNDTAVNVIWVKEKTPMIVTIQTPRDQEVLEPIFAMLETVEKTKTSKPQEKEANPDEQTSSSPAVTHPSKKTITYTVEGKKKSATGTLYTSSNQPFSLYLLPNYQADAVEPHLDRVYVKDNEQYYMDIELLEEKTDWNQVEFETMEKLKAVNENVTKKVWNQPDSLLSGMTVYHANNKEHWVQAFLIKNKAHYPNMRITIHMPKDDVHFAEFLAMARTIMQN
jgi:hypothetical protein